MAKNQTAEKPGNPIVKVGVREAVKAASISWGQGLVKAIPDATMAINCILKYAFYLFFDV